jgi:hypothetical protein
MSDEKEGVPWRYATCTWCKNIYATEERAFNCCNISSYEVDWESDYSGGHYRISAGMPVEEFASDCSKQYLDNNLWRIQI